MKLHPTGNSSEVIIKDYDSFIKKLSYLTEGNLEHKKHTTIFQGTIKKNSFVLIKKLIHHNSFRPAIKGTISVDKKSLKLEIVNNKFQLYFSGIVLLAVTLFGIFSQNIILLFSTVTTTFIFFYLLGWGLFNKDLKHTREGIKTIKRIAEEEV
jgi:hypothetical protein